MKLSMYDRELALEILTHIYDSTQTISKRFEPVKSVEDFTGSEGGMEKGQSPKRNYHPSLF